MALEDRGMSQVIDWNNDQIGGLITHLSENIRVDRSRPAEYDFMDIGFADQLTAKTNHVVYGRRGSGKSALLRELESRCVDKRIEIVLIDMEAIAEKSYPGRIIRLLIKIFQQVHDEATAGKGIFGRLGKRGKLVKEIEDCLTELNTLQQQPDQMKRKVTGKTQNQKAFSLDPTIAGVRNVLDITAKISGNVLKEQGIETEETWQRISVLFNSIDKYRSAIQQWLDFTEKEAMFLLVDDFYQIDMMHQPLVADYLKRLTRGIACYLKFGTVRHRSLLFVKDQHAEAGIQVEQDYVSLSLDFFLDDFQQAKNFLTGIFNDICERILGAILPDALFDLSGVSGMDILTEASGGNPRDFINLLKNIIFTKRLMRDRNLITYNNIRVAATSYHKQIWDEVKGSYVYSDTLNALLRKATYLCKEKGDIGFYVSKREAINYASISFLIGQLMDSRFIHLLMQAYSPPAPENGTATVYILSMGIYSEFLSDISLVKRQTDLKDYPKLSLEDVSKDFPELPKALEFLGKAIS